MSKHGPKKQYYYLLEIKISQLKKHQKFNSSSATFPQTLPHISNATIELDIHKSTPRVLPFFKPFPMSPIQISNRSICKLDGWSYLGNDGWSTGMKMERRWSVLHGQYTTERRGRRACAPSCLCCERSRLARRL
jgi:hypothetical protein